MSNGPTDRFAEACGLTGPLLVQLEGPGPQDHQSLEFDQPFLVVGRDPIADLTIDDPDVGPRHAYLQVIDGRIFCLNIGSRSGIHWEEGPRLASWVETGNGIRIGPVRIRFGDLEVGPGGNLPISEEFEWPSSPEGRLEFLGDESHRKPWPITRALSLLGSSPICRVHLPGPGVGRMHAAIVRTPTGFWAVDLLGPGGLLVRGATTRYALLEDGDEIGLGPHRMRFMTGALPETPGHSRLAKRSPERVVQPTRTIEEQDLVREPQTVSLDAATTNRLLEEFDRMHQRTVDQFQQAMLMMFRMHQDQMDTIRDELSRLDRLEDEQKTLRAEISRQNSSPPPPPQQQQHRMALRMDLQETPHPTPRPKGRIADDADVDLLEPPSWKLPTPPSPDARIADPDDAPISGKTSMGSYASSFVASSEPHARLAQRIAEIHVERQGLWKKIMASLSGDTSQKRIP